MTTGNQTQGPAEFESIETFVQELIDDDRNACTLQERNRLASSVGKTPAAMERELNAWGIRVLGRPEFQHQLAA